MAAFRQESLKHWLLAVVVSRNTPQNHGIIESWDGLGQKGHKTHPVPPPCPWKVLGWSQTVAVAAQGTHHESSLLLSCLEAAVAEFGSGINEFELDGFVGPAARVHQEGLGKNSHNSRGIITEQLG